MTRPILEVLNRIRWDPEFDGGRRFALSYLDHSKAIPVVVPFSYITFDAGSSRMIGLVDPNGDSRKIPTHRIFQVFRDGVPIWERPPRPPRAAGRAGTPDNERPARPANPDKGASAEGGGKGKGAADSAEP